MLLERQQQYDLLRPIGRGGMGEVFLASARGAHGFTKTVAVKRIRAELSKNEEFVRRFVMEAKLAVSVSHANIVQVFDLGYAAGELFIAMEYVDGTDLGRVLSTLSKRQERAPVAYALYLIIEALKGLAYAHGSSDGTGRTRAIVHCDISPSNLLVSYAGEVKVTDFGVARVAAQGGVAPPNGQIEGKPSYMPPEALQGAPPGPRVDVFAMGLVLHELLLGRRLGSPLPVELEPLTVMRPEVPASLERAIAAATASDPRERPADAAEMLRTLTSIAHELKEAVTPTDAGRWVSALVPPAEGVPAVGFDGALKGLVKGAAPHTGTESFVTHTSEDGITVWERLPPPQRASARGRWVAAAAAGCLALGAGAGLFLWTRAAPPLEPLAKAGPTLPARPVQPAPVAEPQPSEPAPAPPPAPAPRPAVAAVAPQPARTRHSLLAPPPTAPLRRPSAASSASSPSHGPT
jgi:serine/threonine-protein kinase